MLPKLLCDENIPRFVISALKEKGFVVETAVSGSDDNKVAGIA